MIVGLNVMQVIPLSLESVSLAQVSVSLALENLTIVHLVSLSLLGVVYVLRRALTVPLLIMMREFVKVVSRTAICVMMPINQSV